MDQESNQMEQQSVQCRNGCGFYGNAASEGYCSVCYKDIIKKKQQPPTNMPASLAPAPGQMAGLSIDEASKKIGAPSLLETASPTVIVPPSQNERSQSESDPVGAIAIASPSGVAAEVASSPANSDAAEDSGPGKEGKKKKNRCQSCKKKVGLTGFECRCGGLFCSMHRYSDKHECDFDYKELGAEEIRKSNPVVVANKIQKI